MQHQKENGMITANNTYYRTLFLAYAVGPSIELQERKKIFLISQKNPLLTKVLVVLKPQHRTSHQV